MHGVLLAAGLELLGPEPVSFQWQAPDACPDQAKVRGRIEHFLGRELDAPREHELDIRAEVTGDRPGPWTVRIVTRTKDGERERTLSHEANCAQLAEGAALIVALTIDPTAVAEAHADEPDPIAPTPEPAAEPKPEPEPPPAKPRPRPRGAMRLHGGAGAGMLPRLELGLGGSAAFLLHRVRIEILGSYWFPRRVRVQEEPEAGADFSAWTVGVRGCGVLHARPLEFPLCAGADLGQLRGTGFGLDNARTERELWASLHLAPSVVIVLHRFVGVAVVLDGFAPLRRPVFTIGDHGTVHRPSPVGIHGYLAVEMRFP